MEQLKCFTGGLSYQLLKPVRTVHMMWRTVTGCWLHSPKEKWHIHHQSRRLHQDKGAARCSPFLRCSSLLFPMILIKVSSSVPNLPSPAANRSCNGRETLVDMQTWIIGTEAATKHCWCCPALKSDLLGVYYMVRFDHLPFSDLLFNCKNG